MSGSSGRRAGSRPPIALPLALVLALALALLASTATPAHAGPWTHGPGGGYAKAWFSLLPGVGWSRELGSPPELTGYYQEAFVGTYAEIGFAPRLDATLHWTPLRTFLLVDSVDAPTVAASVGEPAVGLRWQAVQAGREGLLHRHEQVPREELAAVRVAGEL